MLSIRVNESRQFLGDSRWRAQKKGWTSVRALSTMVSLMPQQAAPSPDDEPPVPGISGTALLPPPEKRYLSSGVSAPRADASDAP